MCNYINLSYSVCSLFCDVAAISPKSTKYLARSPFTELINERKRKVKDCSESVNSKAQKNNCVRNL